MRFGWILALLILATLAPPARADVILLKNGGKLTGRIVEETDRELVLVLKDGMKMRVSRRMVNSIERREEPAEPEPTPRPEPEPRPDPKPTGAEPGGAPDPAPPDEPKITKPVGPAAGTTASLGFFEEELHRAWNQKFADYPEITAAKLTRFRAYEYVSHALLPAAPGDPHFAPLIRRHGHGGAVARWKLRYAGNRELRYGDRVKFIAEITSPPEPAPPLIEMELGPTPTVERVVVLLIKRGNNFFRYATTTVFTARDFRTAEITALSKARQPVRTHTLGYDLVATNWLIPEDSEFLADVTSPYGDSLRARMSRLRFRMTWFAAPEKARQELDAELLARGDPRPVAAPGRPVATGADVLKHWNSEEFNRRKLQKLRVDVKTAFARFGMRTGSGYYIERDMIGMFGRRGLTVETRRYALGAALLDELLRE